MAFGVLAKRLFGKIRRKTATIPNHPVIKRINGAVVFEHKYLPFLDKDDFRAFLTHSYDISTIEFFKRHLSAGDIFMDIGANIGYMSAWAASFVGTSGEVHGFEPLCECFDRLKVMERLNPLYLFRFQNVAVGPENGVVLISFDPHGDARNATLVPGKERAVSREVPVMRLDDYIADYISAPRRIKLIKIDVEGYEFAVLRGLERFLSDSTTRPAIICEIKPWELKNLGNTIAQFADYMEGFGYHCFDVDRETKQIDLRSLRDWATVQFRV